MRMLPKMQMDVEAGNRAIRDGSFGEMLERVMGQIKPEAAYFTAIRRGFLTRWRDDVLPI